MLPLKQGKNTIYYALIISFCLRILLYSAVPQDIRSVLQSRVELSTPVNSFMRLKECSYFLSLDFPLYSAGGLCSHPFLLVYLLYGLNSLNWFFGYDMSIFMVCSLLDVVIGYVAYIIAERHLKTDDFGSFGENSKLEKDQLRFKANVIDKESVSPLFVACIYLFSPFTILSTLSLSTIIFTNISIVLAIYYQLVSKMRASMFFLAIGTYLSFYPSLLLIPLVVISSDKKQIFKQKLGCFLYYILFYFIFLFLLFMTTIFCLGGGLGNFSQSYNILEIYIDSTIGFILRIDDLTPNIGLNWYFFTEMFYEFRMFFVLIFHLFLLSWVIPLTIKFKEDPLFCYFLILASISIFKSYPSLGDTALWMGVFLPLQKKTFKYMRNVFISANLIGNSFILLPFFHYIWIYRGSGNSNFFYAITLLWAFGQVLLVTDSAFGWLRRKYDIYIFSSNDETCKEMRTTPLILK